MKRFGFLLLIFLSAVFFPTSAARADAQDVTLLQILSNPREHDRERVRVIGYLHLERDGNAVYLHEDDFKFGIFGNAVYVDITDDMRNHREQLSGQYVIIEGVYDAQARGPFEVYSGTIKSIWRCEIWSPKDGSYDRGLLKEKVSSTVL